MLHRPGIWKDREKYMNRSEDEREEYDMCQALQEICDERESIGFHKGMEKGIEQGIEQGIERGIEQGIKQGMEKGIERGIKALIVTCKSLNCTKKDTERQLKRMFEFEKDDEAMKKVDLYW